PREFWTVTVWADEHSMRQYRSTGVHRKAISHLPEWCDEAAVAHWEQEGVILPDWNELHRRMEQTGRRSRVNHPSQEHSAEPWTVRPPRWRLERAIQGASAAAHSSS
ncbi:MAG: DUF3291 domain-containing protein, partial [Acidobacteriota bacterium]|nr:DUF3291 domain-containing protein [Acidobacteriota bacterium]